MNIFAKKNLEETFRSLAYRKAQLSEQTEWFDGSDGELEVIAENKFISAAFDAFHKEYGSSPIQYFNLDEPRNEEEEEALQAYNARIECALV